MRKNNEFLFGETTDQIIGAAYNVYNKLGYGYLEKVYQKALEVELSKLGLGFQRECYGRIEYDGEVIGKYFLDFLIEEKIAVELKVRREMYDTDWIQLLNYLKAKDLQVGLLIVIAKNGLKIKRVVN